MKGQTGKILRVNLTNKSITTLATSQYETWGGGYGMGVAIWYDLVADKTISGFDPLNPVLIMPGLFSGTMVPASARCAMIGNGVQAFPVEYFTWSNAGGRLAPAIKHAGYDGIIVEGAAKTPTWINIVDSDVEIRDAQADGLWGVTTWDAEKIIFGKVSGGTQYNGGTMYNDWIDLKSGTRTMQRPAVAVIGPAGENLVRYSIVLHDLASAFGEGGFGAVWGSKKLKAISVLGTGGVQVADPKAMMDDRLWSRQNYAANVDENDIKTKWSLAWLNRNGSHFAGHPFTPMAWEPNRRPYACEACHQGCRSRTATGLNTEAMCVENTIYTSSEAAKYGTATHMSSEMGDLQEKLGLNARVYAFSYLQALNTAGVLGPGKQINTDLDFTKVGDASFFENLSHKIAYRQDVGNDIAEGYSRAATKWGRYDQDSKKASFPEDSMGHTTHSSGPVLVDWSIEDVTLARDANDHVFRDQVERTCGYNGMTGSTGYDGTVNKTFVTAEELATRVSARMLPFKDARAIDSSRENAYSPTMANRSAWVLWYMLYYKNSLGLCDSSYPDFANPYAADKQGLTPVGEERFFKSVTGNSQSFVDGMQIGRKILNLTRSILVMQGRRSNMEVLAEKNYVDYVDTGAYYAPQFLNGQWVYQIPGKVYVDRAGFEQLKVYHYTVQGWDTKTGWPTRSTLESLGLKYVADDLAKLNKLP